MSVKAQEAFRAAMYAEDAARAVDTYAGSYGHRDPAQRADVAGRLLTPSLVLVASHRGFWAAVGLALGGLRAAFVQTRK